jgi:hypothetical protein
MAAPLAKRPISAQSYKVNTATSNLPKQTTRPGFSMRSCGHGWRNDPHSKTEHASKFNSYIANVVKANPNVGIKFTASSAHQIGQVTAALK